jgi:molybdate transport system ATP-binding protein
LIQFDCSLRQGAFSLEAAFEAGSGITALFGPSGSGKSTVLKLIAGLLAPDRGLIRFDSITLTDTVQRVFVPPHRRRIGYVLQDSLLFPHLSVRSNLRYGERFTPKPERRIAHDAVVDMLGISHLQDRRTDSLSGGERQRVAIGRAFLMSPQLLLMDEPLASLDAARKAEILPFIERLRDAFAIPVLYVSHATDEVQRLASSVIRIENGRIVQA